MTYLLLDFAVIVAGIGLAGLSIVGCQDRAATRKERWQAGGLLLLVIAGTVWYWSSIIDPLYFP